MKKFIFLFSFSIIYICHLQTASAETKEYFIEHKGRPQKVLYDLYYPENKNNKPLPILICIGGLAGSAGNWQYSLPNECRTDAWKEFAQNNQLAMLSLGFLFIDEDWVNKESYQFPKAWSGKAITDILKILSKEYSIDVNHLYTYGISAGSQLSIRFAQMHPNLVKGTAGHAAGGYDEPTEYIPTKFLITVGEKDITEEYSRAAMAEEFTKLCREKGIDIRVKIIPDLGHRQTQEQDQMSREFFEKILLQSTQ